MLNYPHGIFLDNYFNLYVADTNNNRIQRFAFNDSNGITVAGFGSSKHIKLNRPTGVVVDNDNNLFIIDSNSYRIIRSVYDGFRCVAGCSSASETTFNELQSVYWLDFFKNDIICMLAEENLRPQTIDWMTNSCSKFTRQIR